MCLLIAAKGGAEIPDDHIRESAKRNRDGFGYSIYTPEGLIVYKGMDLEAVMTSWKKSREQFPAGEALWHLRFATSGKKDHTNCHPFYLGGDQETVMAHNGVLNVSQDKNDPRSDTHACAETVMALGGKYAEKGIYSILETRNEWEEWLGKGNKLAFLSVKTDVPNLIIFNEELGNWEGDVWYSNTSWKKYEPSNYSMYWWRSEDEDRYSSREWKHRTQRNTESREYQLPPWVDCKLCGPGYGHQNDCTVKASYGTPREKSRIGQAASVFAAADVCPICDFVLSPLEVEAQQCKWCKGCLSCEKSFEECDCEVVTLFDEDNKPYSLLVTKEEFEQYEKERDEEEEGLKPSESVKAVIDGEVIDLVWSFTEGAYVTQEAFDKIRAGLYSEFDTEEEFDNELDGRIAPDTHGEITTVEDFQKAWDSATSSQTLTGKLDVEKAWERALLEANAEDKRSRLYVANHAQIIPINGVSV